MIDANQDAALNMLHNRELEFYSRIDKVKLEDTFDPDDISCLLQFYGGTRCDNEPVSEIILHPSINSL